ncbi:MAG: hypothetical protein HOW73_46805 [Polyangiaceae bacterium]|nr:hypothetical protein [Polyangiaceae bacterium]
MNQRLGSFAIITMIGAFTGCAAIQASEAKSTEDVLAAAGFRQFPADTPERQQALDAMKPRTITTVTKNGKRYWVYPDPEYCQCLYAGSESEYQEFKRLSLEKEIADQNLQAAEEAQDAAMRWQTWGPWW